MTVEEMESRVDNFLDKDPNLDPSMEPEEAQALVGMIRSTYVMIKQIWRETR